MFRVYEIKTYIKGEYCPVNDTKFVNKKLATFKTIKKKCFGKNFVPHMKNTLLSSYTRKELKCGKWPKIVKFKTLYLGFYHIYLVILPRENVRWAFHFVLLFFYIVIFFITSKFAPALLWNILCLLEGVKCIRDCTYKYTYIYGVVID